MQHDPGNLLKQAPSFLCPSPPLLLGPPQKEETSNSADGVGCAGVDGGPESRGDGQMPSRQDERTWLLYPQVHCPLPRPK